MELEALKVLYTQLPAIAEAIGKGYNGADIHLIGNDSGQLAGDIMTNVTQISEGMNESLGIDLKALLASFIGGKVAQNGASV